MNSLPWEIYPQNPVIIPGQLNPTYDCARAGAAHVIRDADSLVMTYWGSSEKGNFILQARTSPATPNHWQPVADPLLFPQPETDYNNGGPSFPFLLPVTDDYWLLYFCGWGRSKNGKLPNTTGVAISEDGGKTWSYYKNHPIIPMNREYDREGTGSVWVLYENGKFRIYYTSIARYEQKPENVQTGHGDRIPKIGIGYAESDDGLHWEKPFDNWLISPREFGVEPYEYIVSKPCIIHDGNRYYLWVNTFGTAYRVHRLSSSDGLSWEWEKRYGRDGELATGPEGSFDDHQRSYPTILLDNDALHCWYTGNNFGGHGMGYASAKSLRGNR